MFGFIFEIADNFLDNRTEDPKDPKFWPIETRDFSYLYDKKIEWRRLSSQNMRRTGKVLAMDYSVGFTIINFKDHSLNLSCYHGELSPVRTQTIGYHEGFLKAVEMLEKGYYDVDEMHDARGLDRDYGTASGSEMSPCVFSA